MVGTSSRSGRDALRSGRVDVPRAHLHCRKMQNRSRMPWCVAIALATGLASHASAEPLRAGSFVLASPQTAVVFSRENQRLPSCGEAAALLKEFPSLRVNRAKGFSINGVDWVAKPFNEGVAALRPSSSSDSGRLSVTIWQRDGRVYGDLVLERSRTKACADAYRYVEDAAEPK
jgi:hypothetical protein